MRLKNKVAIVTGAASGLGQAIAKAYLAEGAKVVLSDVNSVKINNKNACFVKCDVSDSKQVENLVKETIKKFKKLDIMVNNAGVGNLGSVVDTTDEVWQKVIDINLSGVFYGSREAAKQMKKQKIKGVIINMSSILGKVGFAGALSYCAAKGGVVQLTHAAALDLAPLGIRINAIAPGFIATNMTKDVLKSKQFNDMVKMNTPLGRVGESNDIAQAAVYLASDEAKYVTGEVLYVDGGWTAR